VIDDSNVPTYLAFSSSSSLCFLAAISSADSGEEPISAPAEIEALKLPPMEAATGTAVS